MHDELVKFCPNCPPIYAKKAPEIRVGHRLQVIRSNYSGCGVDHCECTACRKLFQVTYKVDEITPLSR